jgi:NACalpha-BTF3-like transcription factor
MNPNVPTTLNKKRYMQIDVSSLYPSLLSPMSKQSGVEPKRYDRSTSYNPEESKEPEESKQPKKSKNHEYQRQLDNIIHFLKCTREGAIHVYLKASRNTEIDIRDLCLVMQQSGCGLSDIDKCITCLIENDGDLVNAIMDLSI